MLLFFESQFPLPDGMNDISGFESWFIQLKTLEHTVVSCPDSMFFTTKNTDDQKQEWMQLAQLVKVSVQSMFL